MKPAWSVRSVFCLRHDDDISNSNNCHKYSYVMFRVFSSAFRRASRIPPTIIPSARLVSVREAAD